jgi:hypothetical protein
LTGFFRGRCLTNQDLSVVLEPATDPFENRCQHNEEMSHLASQGFIAFGAPIAPSIGQLDQFVPKVLQHAGCRPKDVGQSEAIVCRTLHRARRLRSEPWTRLLHLAEPPMTIRAKVFDMRVEAATRDVMTLQSVPVRAPARDAYGVVTCSFEDVPPAAFKVMIDLIHEATSTQDIDKTL